MLTIFGRKNAYCDGISRRSFLSIGALGLGAAALNLTDIFRAEARAGTTGSQHKAVINIFLGGGPPHQDMWDIKTEAPSEIRGEFKPIATNVPGIQIGEVLPAHRSHGDKCVVHPLHRRRHRRPRCGPVHDRLDHARHDRTWAAGPASAPSLPACRGRSIRRCRRSSAWPANAAHAVVRSGHAGLPRHRLRPVQAGRAGHGRHDAQGQPRSISSATANDCSRASTTCAATSTPAVR